MGAVAQAGSILGTGSGPGGRSAVPASLSSQFAAAAGEFHVPLDVLMAVSYQETRWDSHHGQPSATGNFNVMGLTKVDAGDVTQPTASGIAAEAAAAAGDDYRIRHIKHPHRVTARDQAVVPTVNTNDPALHTLDAAASLIHQPTAALKTDTDQSIRGGAALLAQYEKSLTGGLPTDPGQWFPAVARYSQSPDAKGAQLFASRVFGTIRTGMSRLTADGQQVTLSAAPEVRQQGRVATAPTASGAAKAVTTPASFATGTATTPTADCPSTLSCQYVPAAYALADQTDQTSYGNYDIANRPADGSGIAVRYIVIHDTEGSYAGTISAFSALDNPESSAQYVIRSSDGQVTQMVPNTDEAIHAGNKYVNVHSIGVEHEGYAISGASWYTESEYESSAALVKYLAQEYGIPLDRQHVIGHDDVPGPIDSYVSGMHWDPGTFWDWNHYMSLLGAPVPSNPAGAPLVAGEAVTVSIPFTTANEPTVTNCSTCAAIPAQPANFVYLRTSPSSSAPLLADPYLHSSGAGTTDAADWGDKLVTGESFVVAAVQGDWTAIWYGGVKAWFSNPAGSYTVPAPAGTTVITSAGTASAPVYGRAYPETSAYPSVLSAVAAASTQQVTSLTKYAIPAGQAYVAYAPVAGDFYYTENINGDAPGDRTDVVGTTTYREIRFNHRVAFVNTADVKTVATATPPAASTRWNLLARDGSGVLWQYQGTGNASAPLLSRYRVGGGWNIYNTIVPLDALRADAGSAVVARDSSGVLWLYQGTGNAASPFAARVRVGGGWQIYNTLVGVGDVTGDGRADLLGRDSSGVLWLYQGTGNAASPFAARVRVGGGWQTYNTIVGAGDLTGDGRADLVARDSSGVLWLYRGTGIPTAPFAARTKISSGWQGYKTIVGVRDLNGDGKPDLVGVEANGWLWLHAGTGSAAAPLAARVQIGAGWWIFNTVV
ncbi:N-acetylmuramoyl-L-alanine amidase [Streptacidiphilus jiangxiensis]|uniref:N-acetylmuramoyl-L-alanine amidase n=1 Tax=Streptacidiphilus jiangxiensis TaxID=235985 RepID=A0A1H7JAT5_STRJI|nr:N-acetylmuramoyl-L-alanine amidase [Streptacidiphilus jiangxiensis]SEK70405.1 Repeat domain-containing protein [Streptacidiphilus jiangxiensis]